MSSKWRHRSLTSLTSQEQWTTIHGQDITCKMQKHGGEAEAPPVPQRDPADHISGLWWVSTRWPHCPLPLTGTAPHRAVAREPMVPPGEKGAQCGHPSSPSVLGVLLRSCLRGITGESVELDHWKSDWMEKRRAHRNQSLDSVGQVPTTCT